MPPLGFVPVSFSKAVFGVPTVQLRLVSSRTTLLRVSKRRYASRQVVASEEAAPFESIRFNTDSSPDRRPNPTSDSDLKILDDLTSSGESSLRDIGETVQGDLQSVSDKTQEFADNMIAEETEALLARYDEKQKELLANVDEDRRVIENELALISELADEVRVGGRRKGKSSLRVNSLAAAIGIFSVAALIWAFTAVVDGSSDALGNAGMNVLVAAAAAFFFRRESGSGNSVEKD